MVGLFGLMLVLAGLISSFAATLFLRHSPNSMKHFDYIIKILYTITMFASLMLSIIIPLGMCAPVLIVGFAIIGIGALGLQPFECQALEEITYPVQESMSVIGMFFSSNILSFILSQISTLEGI